ncbi:deoxyribose-phosphate aldolase [Antarcticibacterium flavum]|uniref:Deoxyribose-phosphate aldolase n=1 Tax=Antarcticibacterium flavum TaxID=2058175 RepID=A0A5B7X018_9FLAO|nr:MULTISPECIES: deoxyribose-phosphate aldolase [Antarcticibacterium]MCM4160851.1 deoxyribose-phosphate aldolase [Antarcticibacterium sp. W02-3]QCY68018.1 deoxyribose-phosphate aldolase [Antarcticibacterium flavum]
MNLNKYIDHTLLKPTATPADIKELCKEAREHDFYAVCVNGSYVELAVSMLKDSNVKVAAVIGFPLGAMSQSVKVAEAKDCVAKGAGEIDMVINLGMLKAGHLKAVEDEIKAIKQAIGDEVVLKVIIETCYLTNEEKINACKAALNAQADFVKTSTGFGAGGATPEDVKIMKNTVGNRMQIKASGGIKDKETALEYINLGATRLGTSSGIQLVSENNETT